MKWSSPFTRGVVRATALLLFNLVLFASIGAPQGFTWPERGENMQVLPKDFTGQRIRAVMTGFSNALGVRCSYCHVGEEGQPLSTYDFPSDENPKKNIARKMLNMLGVIGDTLQTLDRGEQPVNMWCHTCHSGRPRPTTISEELRLALQDGGVDAAIARYRELRDRYYGRGTLDFSETVLNTAGYQLLGAEQVDDAIRVFLLNVEYYPESGNAYDSLAEGYLTRGDRELAETYYMKSLEIDPTNQNAVDKLREIRVGD